MSLNESIVEDAALEWFGELGYSCLGAEALTPTLSHGERESYCEVVGRLREALRQLNLAISQSHTLATLRDPATAGLPKLLSGELSVEDVSRNL